MTNLFQIKNEVAQVLEMMREYLSKTGKLGTPAGPPGSGNAAAVSDILDSFTRRLTLHQTKVEIWKRKLIWLEA